jgi:fibronectin type 3 domain-containing protein
MKKLITLLVMVIAVATSSAAWLEWDRNVEPEVAGYRVYVGTASRSYYRAIDVGNQTIWPINGVTAGTTYYYAVTAYTADGLESDFSDEVSYTPTVTVPIPPTDPTSTNQPVYLTAVTNLTLKLRPPK